MSYYNDVPPETGWLSDEAAKARRDSWKRTISEYNKTQRRMKEMKEIEERVAEHMRIRNMYNRFDIMEFD